MAWRALTAVTRKLGSHSKEDCTKINWSKAIEEELHFDVRRGRCPTIDAQGTLDLDLSISIGKKGVPL